MKNENLIDVEKINIVSGHRIFKLSFEILNKDDFDEYPINDKSCIQAQHMIRESEYQMLSDEFSKTTFSEYILDQLVKRIKNEMREQCMEKEKTNEKCGYN